MEPPIKIRRFRQFLADGDRGFYVYLDGRVVHRSWVQFGPRTVDRYHDLLPMILAPREAYIHFCETAPQARGSGIYPAVLAHILNTLKAEARPRCHIATSTSNVASCRGIVKAGFRECERTRVLSVLFLTFRFPKAPCATS